MDGVAGAKQGRQERADRVPVYLTPTEKRILQVLASHNKRSMSAQVARLIRDEAKRLGVTAKSTNH